MQRKMEMAIVGIPSILKISGYQPSQFSKNQMNNNHQLQIYKWNYYVKIN